MLYILCSFGHFVGAIGLSTDHVLADNLRRTATPRPDQSPVLRPGARRSPPRSQVEGLDPDPALLRRHITARRSEEP